MRGGKGGGAKITVVRSTHIQKHRGSHRHRIIHKAQKHTHTPKQTDRNTEEHTYTEAHTQHTHIAHTHTHTETHTHTYTTVRNAHTGKETHTACHRALRAHTHMHRQGSTHNGCEWGNSHKHTRRMLLATDARVQVSTDRVRLRLGRSPHKNCKIDLDDQT